MKKAQCQTLRAQAAFLMMLGAASVPALAAEPAAIANGAVSSMEPGGGADSAPLAQARGICDGIRIDVMTDSAPDETRWELSDHVTGTVLAQRDFVSRPGNTLDSFCRLGGACYDFTIFDLFGDGLCCEFGAGFYQIYYFDVLVAEGNSFGFSETVSAIGDCDFSDFSVTASATGAVTRTGNTCGAADDCGLEPSEEVIYKVTIPLDGTWTFSLCESSYDTKLFVGTSSCADDVGKNDDSDSCSPQSEVRAIDLPAGTYFATLEGLHSNFCGAYTLTISGECLCGDGACEASCGEQCATCPDDCGPCTCSCDTTIDTYPHCSGFESGFGDWRSGQGGDFDWTRQTGGTPTFGSGPDAAHGGDYYVYTEASGNTNKTAILEACFDLSALGDPTLDFWYHMKGFSMGTLRVDVSEDNCGTWTEVWRQDGSPGFDWLEAMVDLSAYTGSSITVRFVGLTGNGVTSDMALDDICVRGTPVLCPVGTNMTFAMNGMTDAGQPHPIDDAATAQGYDVFTASGPPNATDPSCWRFSDTNAGDCGNGITGVTETSPGQYEITLLRPLQSRSVTTITYDWGAGSRSGVYTALPGDANGSDQTNTADIGAVIECLTTGACDVWTCDIDRLGGCTGADLERLIDLLNGAGLFNGWDGAMPASIDCPPI